MGNKHSHFNIIINGSECSGKTTILRKLLNRDTQTYLSECFTSEVFGYKKATFTMFDFGRLCRAGTMTQFINSSGRNADALIIVIDSYDLKIDTDIFITNEKHRYLSSLRIYRQPSGQTDLSIPTNVIIPYVAKENLNVKEMQKEITRLTDDKMAISNIPVLIYANKQDTSEHYSVDEINKIMDFQTILRSHNWMTQPCSAITGEGLLEGIEWLYNMLIY